MQEQLGTLPIISMPGFEAALNTLKEQASAQDAVLFRVSESSVENWFNPSLQYYLYGSPLHVSLLSLVNEHDDVPFSERLDRFIGNASRVWTAVVPGIAPDAQTTALEEALSARYTYCRTVLDMPDMQLDLYTRGVSSACPAAFPVDSQQMSRP
jgi:hypothetical protein